jgi:hypothetical protein
VVIQDDNLDTGDSFEYVCPACSVTEITLKAHEG